MNRAENTHYQELYAIASPNGTMHLHIGTESVSGRLWYELMRGKRSIIKRSRLSLITSDDQNLLRVSEQLICHESSHDETWEQPWGEQRYIRDNHRELTVSTSTFTVRFRLFDDGLGFRYEIKGDGAVTIATERTEFNFHARAQGWWIPSLQQNHYEHLYAKTPLSEVAIAHTPMAIELPDGDGYVSIHEAALYDYGGINLRPTKHGLISYVTPRADGSTAHIILPFTSPWRTITVSDTAVGLTSPKIMLNLNEPSKIEDTSWIKPSKFMGIWWGMFIGHFTWSSGDKHGATTANALRYINACKKLGIPALLIEGWNETWDGDWTKNGDKMNLMQPYPDFDIHMVTSYAKSQGVEIVGHHETAGNIDRYESQLPEALDYYRHLDVNYIKTGYVSEKISGGEFHYSQPGVKHYQKVVELAAERKIMLDIHEPVIGTGISRTWPNLMSREGAMGQEYEGGNITPEHTTILPYTRMLAGPLDYTPGLFNLRGTERKIQTTLAKQLAFYVTLYSPLQMVADLPEHYEGQPAFQFIQDVPVNWETSVPIDGVIGDYFIVARKDRDSGDWYIGAVNDENARTVSIPLQFLPQDVRYQATSYQDTEQTHYQNNPEAIDITNMQVVHSDVLAVYLAPGGGCAIRLTPETDNHFEG